MANQAFSLRPATEADFEPVLALSIRAMRPHLERIGRFDPARRFWERLGFVQYGEADHSWLMVRAPD